MGQPPRNGRGLRQGRQEAPRRVRSEHGPAVGARRSQATRRTVEGALPETLARGFVLQGYDRTTEELRIELHLKPVPVERLRALFDIGNDYEMCNAYPLDATSARELEELVTEKIDTGKYDFFLQRYV